MSAYYFSAENYSLGTTLESLNWTEHTSGTPHELMVQSESGFLMFKSQTTNNYNTSLFTLNGVTPAPANQVTMTRNGGVPSVYQRVLLRYVDDNNQLRVSWAYENPVYKIKVEKYVAGVLTTITSTESMSGPNFTLDLATRTEIGADNVVRVKLWQQADMANPEADEPVSWSMTLDLSGDADLQAGGALEAGVPGFFAGGNVAIDSIGLGTAGDEAPCIPVPTPFVATPTGLNTTNVTSSSARLNWS